ncbi:retrotransposon protein, putative, ty1-copia subclass [Tanacetum coccineum]
MDWMRNLRFTLRYENKEYVLDEQIPTINDDSTQEEIEAHQKHYDDANKVSCIMASSMSPELQKERLDVVKSLMSCKPKPGASICAFVLEMKGYFNRLESLNIVFDAEISINIILFGIKKIDVPSTSADLVLTVGHNAKKRKTSHSNYKGKAAQGKSDRGSKRKDESEIAPTSDPKEAVCFYCNTKGHWKHSCPKYLKDLKNGNVEKGGHSVSQLTPPRTPQLNGVAERRNRTVDMFNYDVSSTLPISLGREAQDKLEARFEKCLFVGYPEESFGYLFYKPKDNVVFVARGGVFLEIEMISKEDSGSKIYLEEIQESADEEPIVNVDTQQEVVTPMDVKTAFLNGKLTEDVFMALPKGFENAKYPKRVCKLQKAIYGLKQASHSWNLCLHEKVTQFVFLEAKMSHVYIMVSRHQQNPGEAHWTAIKNILKYLRNTKDKFLVHGGEEELIVTGYCDASWQTDKDDSRS